MIRIQLSPIACGVARPSLKRPLRQLPGGISPRSEVARTTAVPTLSSPSMTKGKSTPVLLGVSSQIGDRFAAICAGVRRFKQSLVGLPASSLCDIGKASLDASGLWHDATPNVGLTHGSRVSRHAGHGQSADVESDRNNSGQACSLPCETGHSISIDRLAKVRSSYLLPT